MNNIHCLFVLTSSVLVILILGGAFSSGQLSIQFAEGQDSKKCDEWLVEAKRYDGKQVCLKPTSVYPLMHRGWASADTDTAAISVQVAKGFVQSAPTFFFDGIEETLEIGISLVRESFPEQYVIKAQFSSRHGGFGDRTDQIVTQVITQHSLRMVVSGGMVVSAIMDEKWDELLQKPWKEHLLPDVDKAVTQNSDVFVGGTHKVEANSVQYDDATIGYLATPTEEGDYPGVIMIHEWWGLNENIRDMAEKLASHGYTVLAVDLFDGQVAETADVARQITSSFDQPKGIQNMNKAVTFLEKSHQVNKMGSIGWCFGGGQSLRLGLSNQNMDATVIYYGNLVTNQEQLSTIDWPVLGIFAELDRGIPPSLVNEFKAALEDLGIPNDVNVYPGVDHAFANPTGQSYAPQESGDAWKKTLDFLNANLR